MVPSFTFEHLEHGDVFLVERIAFDQLKMQGLKAPLACRGNFVLSKSLFDLRHRLNLAIPRQSQRWCRFTSLRPPRHNKSNKHARRIAWPTHWKKIKEWPELYLERLEDAGVARITLNRPDKRNCWNRPLCNAFLESLDIIRADKELKIVITRGAGKVYSSGLDLTFLREVSNGPMLDWDRPNLTIQIAEDVRAFPRIMIAQVHGYCLGGALGIMNCHDLVFAAEDAQLGMPEVLRGSFGQLVTSTLLHSGLPVKKLVADRARRQERHRQGGRRARHHQPGGAGRQARSAHDRVRARPRDRAILRRSNITRSPCRWAATSRCRRRSSSTSWSASGCAA